jgi:eukaryotic-like serine/threonine-protein kinase
MMQVGERVGPFDIEKRIGAGAMGAVYRARYRKTGKQVALKVMLAGGDDNPLALARFEREAEVLKQLDHPNIVRFYAASQHQGAPYYAMEFIEGEPVDELLERRGRLTWEEVVEIGRQVCAALQHAHDQGIVHRDLKPSNLMITSDGTVKLTDFGIAKDLDVTQLTAAHCTVGTAAYMSPEQCRGERNLSHKSDLYSLGVVLYELLTGRKPFVAETTMDMFLQHVQGKFERPSRLVLDIPVWLDTLVCQLLEKAPEHRPYDAHLVSDALNRVAEKVAAQQSAGIDAARSRRGDAGTRPVSMDATDRQAARSLLTSKRRGRRKRRARGVAGSRWIQAAFLLTMLVVIAGLIWKGMQPPTPEALFARAQSLMASGDPSKIEDARSGPIQEYLRYHGDRQDEQAHQIHAWADGYDTDLKERQLYNRRRLMEAENEGESAARRALEREDNGDWEAARERWTELEAKYGAASDHDQHIWGLLAAKRLKALEAASAQDADLQARAEAEALGQEGKSASNLESRAVRAIRFEKFEDFAQARRLWLGIQQQVERDLPHLTWYLIAARHSADLAGRAPANQKEEEVKAGRLALLEKKLAQAEKWAAGKTRDEQLGARVLCHEIVGLYGNDPPPEWAKIVKKAAALLDQLAPAASGPAR